MRPRGSPAEHWCRGCERVWQPGADRCVWCGLLPRGERCDVHPDAVADRACVACGARLCHRCRHGGRHAALCARHARLRMLLGWAEVLRTGDEGRAEVAAGALRAAGVPAQVLSQKDHVYVFAFGGLSVVRVFVPAFRIERAGRVLESLGVDGREARA